MKTILVTNDDGVRSEGIAALAGALEPLGEVTIVAPSTEASAIGHALTLHHPLRVETLDGRTHVVDGTPTDCVNIAIAKILKATPDLVVSGVNKGYNLGDDITYSGTVAGALEAALLGIPAIAVSVERAGGALNFKQAATAAASIAQEVLRRGLPARTLLNVNVPQATAKGFRVTVQGKRNHVTSVVEKIDPRRRPYFWIEEAEGEWQQQDGSDYEAVKNGWISITPLHPDLTNHAALEMVRQLSFGVCAGVE